MEINIKEYNGYKSKTSYWKAMCVTIGDFKLYFSYDKLIAFETPDVIYKTNKKFNNDWGNVSLTTQGHKYAAGYWRKHVEWVEHNLLKTLIYTELLNQSFKEATSNAGLRCERVH